MSDVFYDFKIMKFNRRMMIFPIGVSCGHPGNISNGEHSGVSYLYEDVITYFCDPGYITSDNITMRCAANGTWDRQLPTCQSKDKHICLLVIWISPVISESKAIKD